MAERLLDIARIVVTFFPAKEKETGETAAEIGDLRESLYNDVNGDPRFASQCKTCFDLAALAIYHAVVVFLEKVTDKDLQVFRIFEEYISELTESQIASLKRFRNDMNESKTDKTFFRLLDYEDDITNLLELRNIEDELGTLLKLISEQSSVVDRMLVNFKSIPTQGVSPWAVQWLYDALEKIKGYRVHVEEMIKSCQSAQDAYKSLLDMKQKQANVDEASATRLSGEVAAKQSRAIMIFTVFTIIFLPLSFFTSLFGMNTREWSGSSTNPRLHTIFVIMFPVSFAVIIIVLLAAILVMDQPTRQLVAWAFLESWKSIPPKFAGFISQLRSRTKRREEVHEKDLESGQATKQGFRSRDPSRTRGKPISETSVEFVGLNGRPKSNVD